MSRDTLLASDENGDRIRFVLEVFAEGEHWTSTLARLDETGAPGEAAVAPRFYGTTAEQARRRMLQVLENQFKDVQVVAEV
jgi:hypothetical protein